MAPPTCRLLSAASVSSSSSATNHQATGAVVASESRCQCSKTSPRVDFKNIQSLSVTPPGPHCAQTEVIATLKGGQKVCLDPEAPSVQKIIQKISNKGKAN